MLTLLLALGLLLPVLSDVPQGSHGIPGGPLLILNYTQSVNCNSRSHALVILSSVGSCTDTTACDQVQNQTVS